MDMHLNLVFAHMSPVKRRKGIRLSADTYVTVMPVDLARRDGVLGRT